MRAHYGTLPVRVFDPDDRDVFRLYFYALKKVYPGLFTAIIVFLDNSGQMRQNHSKFSPSEQRHPS